MTSNYSINYITKQLRAEENSIDELCDFLPCHIHLNRISDFGVVDINHELLNSFGMTLKELISQGPQFLANTVAEEDLTKAIEANGSYLANLENQSHTEFIQRLYYEPTNFKTNLYTIGKLLNSATILNLSVPIDSLELFGNNIFKFYDESDFIKRNIYKYNTLTSKEIDISAMMAKGYSLVEIADKQRITQNTLKKHRSNIYTKMEVKNYFEFYNFARAFGMHR